ncbi:hypothetical protein PHYBLDRAFT_160498, partial [Phycomyces blakesleeanus NRRL 1555(-)]
MNGFIHCANFDIFVLVLVCPKKELNIVVGGVNLDSVLKLCWYVSKKRNMLWLLVSVL